MATIRDVASRAGVSTATVSHVLNDTRTVLPDTRRAVLQAIKDLNYRPSLIARSLNTQSTHTIGMIVANIAFPLFAQLLRGIEALLIPAKYSVIVCNTDENPEREAHYLEDLLRRRVDGVFAVPTGHDQPAIAEFDASGVPLVWLDRRPPRLIGHFVGMDNAAAGYLATEHLIRQGHTRIGLLIRSSQFSTNIGRVDGYRRALHAHGLKVNQSLVQADRMTIEDAAEGARRLLLRSRPPSAVIAGNYTMTLGLLLALRDLGLRFPDDVSIVCFDDSPWAQVTAPPLTVVAQPIDAMCRSAVDLMLGDIARGRNRHSPGTADRTKPWREVSHPPELIVRGSARAIAGEET